MIDPAIGWIEIFMVPSARTDLVSNIVELAWHPLPSKVIVDELLAEFNTINQVNYNITAKPITSRNPQADSILERAHQRIGNIIRKFKVQDMVIYDENPWDGILASPMFALRAKVHTTTQHTPAQLVFGRHTILNTSHKVNWQSIKKRTQDLINKGNQQENYNKKEYTYSKGDKVLQI